MYIGLKKPPGDVGGRSTSVALAPGMMCDVPPSPAMAIWARQRASRASRLHATTAAGRPSLQHRWLKHLRFSGWKPALHHLNGSAAATRCPPGRPLRIAEIVLEVVVDLDVRAPLVTGEGHHLTVVDAAISDVQRDFSGVVDQRAVAERQRAPSAQLVAENGLQVDKGRRRARRPCPANEKKDCANRPQLIRLSDELTNPARGRPSTCRW